jgi:hypothetical protein
MMKKIALFLIATALFCCCKKDKPVTTEPDPIVEQEGDNGSGFRKLAKTEYMPPQLHYPSSRHTDYIMAYYRYNTAGEPFQILYNDTTRPDPQLNSKPSGHYLYTESYSFTSFGKIKESTTGKAADVTQYYYDSANRLILAVTNKKDSVRYDYNGSLTTGTAKTGTATLLSYYSTNLDSIIQLDATGNRVSKTIYVHNTARELKEAYLNVSRPIVSHFNELTYEVRYQGASKKSSSYNYNHDANGYPIWILRTDSINGFSSGSDYAQTIYTFR